MNVELETASLASSSGPVTVERPGPEESALPATAVLDREVYEAGEAARLLGLHVRTLRNWLDGYSGRGKAYQPVLRRTHPK